MPDSSPEQASKLAKNVLKNTLRIRPGENVVIETWSETLPWAKPFVTEARKMGANPVLLYEDEESFWEALRTGNSRHTGRVGSHEWAALEQSDAYVFFFGPSQWPRFDDISPKNRAGVAAYNGEWYRRAAKAKIRGARLYLGRTSPQSAERWKMDLEAWREELVRASLVPPAELHRRGTKVGERLLRGKVVELRHPNGTQLTFRLRKYPIQLDDSLVDAADLKAGNNMATIPGGVVGVSIDHTSAVGNVFGNHTIYPDGGPATGVKWSFTDGHLDEMSFETGGEGIQSAYAKAPKSGKDRLGYVSIGLNPEITNLPQMEDQEIGSVLLGLGGNSFRGGKNESPFTTWLVVKGADMTIDGKPLLVGGKIA